MTVNLELLDFSSGDCELTINGKTELCSSPQAEDRVLALPDNQPITLSRSYAKGEHQTTVGELRSEVEWGWWGWGAE